MRLLLIFLFFLTGCATLSPGKKFHQSANEISIMAYNVENLFDHIKDKDREDHTYQPIEKKQTKNHKKFCEKMRSNKYRNECLYMDWSSDVVERKLYRVADVIKQVNKGKGPDLLILVEVENERILKRLKDEHLKESNYQTLVLIEGPDKRGIDIAMLSRLPLKGKAKLNNIPFKAKNAEDKKWMARSRGILQAAFTLPDGKTLHAFGVHFPSPRNPSYWRGQAIAHLNKLKSQLPKKDFVVAGGDFNISKEDENNNRLYAKHLGKEWLVSHQIGCQGCRGTNYYHFKTQWSFLDALLFSKNLLDKNSTWKVIPEKIDIPNYSRYQMNRYLSPARFSHNSPVGVSDHWPIYGAIKATPHKKEHKTAQ